MQVYVCSNIRYLLDSADENGVYASNASFLQDFCESKTTVKGRLLWRLELCLSCMSNSSPQASFNSFLSSLRWANKWGFQRQACVSKSLTRMECMFHEALDLFSSEERCGLYISRLGFSGIIILPFFSDLAFSFFLPFIPFVHRNHQNKNDIIYSQDSMKKEKASVRLRMTCQTDCILFIFVASHVGNLF